MNFSLLCLNRSDERKPVSSGDAGASLQKRLGSWLCFSPSTVISLKRRDEWRELWVINSAFILQVFGGFEVIESLGMGDSSEMSVWCPSGMHRPLRGAFVSLGDGGHRLHALKYSTWYSCGQSFLLTHDISPRLISFSCRGRQDQTNVVWNSSGSARRRRRRWGQRLQERWSEEWKRREKESVIQPALCHVVTRHIAGKCYSIKQHFCSQRGGFFVEVFWGCGGWRGASIPSRCLWVLMQGIMDA